MSAPEKKPATAAKPRHTATYATDKRKGGYLVRVVGEYPDKFAGREVPVKTKGGQVHNEKLSRLIWTGADKETGEKVALYAFESRPREQEQLEF